MAFRGLKALLAGSIGEGGRFERNTGTWDLYSEGRKRKGVVSFEERERNCLILFLELSKRGGGTKALL